MSEEELKLTIDRIHGYCLSAITNGKNVTVTEKLGIQTLPEIIVDGTRLATFTNDTNLEIIISVGK